MTTLPPCPLCAGLYTYTAAQQYVCPECAHEWAAAAHDAAQSATLVVRDAHGTPLADGDTVTMIKDLKVKGAAAVLGVGSDLVNGTALAQGKPDVITEMAKEYLEIIRQERASTNAF